MTRTLLALVKASHLAVADVEEAEEGKGSRTVGGLCFLVFFFFGKPTSSLNVGPMSLHII